MSWSGPAASTAQHSASYGQQQPYLYPQPPVPGQYPNGPPQRPPQNRPPKKKGNPIITRYPPPPGYRGPAQPYVPYGGSQPHGTYGGPHAHYQPSHPTQGFAKPPSVHPTPQNMPPTPQYSPGSYGPSPTFPNPKGRTQQGFQFPQNHHRTQPSYGQSQVYSTAQSYPIQHKYTSQQSSYPSYLQQVTPTEPSPHTFAQPLEWQTTYPSSVPAQQKHDPDATPKPIAAFPARTHSYPASVKMEDAEAMGEKPQLYLAWDDWDFDFDGPIWPKSNEPVDPNLSLGVIVWHPAKQVTRALPSTFEQAEEEALQPPPEKLGNGESVSIYFTLENSHEAFLDVRQTDEWHKVKRDPIFVVFPDDEDMEFIPLRECASWQNRPDDPPDGTEVDEDEDMKDSWNVMDGLEQALSGHDGREDQRARSSDQIPKDIEAQKKQRQEDVLAMLGVTGSPKPPSETFVALPPPPSTISQPRMPSSLPAKPPLPPGLPPPARPGLDHHESSASNYNQQPIGPGSMARHHAIPHPPPQSSRTAALKPREEYDPWDPSSYRGYSMDNSHENPMQSGATNRTPAGHDRKADTDADTVDMALSPDASLSRPVPKLERSDSSFTRKRSYGDTVQTDEQSNHHDDHTKRKRRSETSDVYSRR